MRRRNALLTSFLFGLLAVRSLFPQTMATKGPLLPHLDALAGAADSPANRASYISTLMTLTGLDKLHDPFPSAFLKRFVLAEERVHAGKQSLVSELAVSMAFNRVAEIIKSPTRADVDAVHQLRNGLVAQAPHLVTVKISPTSCNPGEAIFLIYLLVANDGLVSGSPLQLPEGTQLPALQATVTAGKQRSMGLLLSEFVNTHSQIDVLRQVEQVLSLLSL